MAQDSIPDIGPAATSVTTADVANAKNLNLALSAVRQQLSAGSSSLVTALDAIAAAVSANLASGTYTPTLTAVANVRSSTAYVCQYMRVGKTVTVSGKVDVGITTPSVTTQLGISLPIASDFSSDIQCAGVASSGASAPIIQGDATNNRAQMAMNITTITSLSYYFTFTYRII